MVLDPLGFSTFTGGLSYGFILDNLLLPALEQIWEDIEAEIRKFGATFAAIANEALLDGPLFVAGAGAIAIPAWFVPGIWKLPAILPGLALDIYAVWRFASFIARRRKKEEFVKDIDDEMKVAGEEWDAEREELEELKDKVGADKAAEIMYEKEAAAIKTAKTFKKQIQEKKFLSGGAIAEMYRALVFAPTPKARAVLAVEVQVALVNILDYANKCLAIEGGWREQAKCYRPLTVPDETRSTPLDALRALARGDYKGIPGAEMMARDAQQHFKGV